MDVGVRELKKRFSAYLQRAARGETIRVKDRGVPCAILGPIPVAVHLEIGVQQGWVTSPKTPAPPQQVRRAHATVRTADVLAEDRGLRL